MKVLLTGVAGYIGSVLARQLLNEENEVVGVDSLIYGGNSLIGIYNHPNFFFHKEDIRDTQKMELLVDNCDAVIHLAAIVGDPACATNPKLARTTNFEASKALIELSNKYHKIKRFIFASTCSNYGKMEGDEFINEDSPLNPISLYAKLKVEFEEYILTGNYRDDLTTTILRFATVYGLSPRCRFDLTVNEFMKEVALGRELQIFGEQFWRPYCHVEDLARACVLVLKSNVTTVGRNVFNVGSTNENYQKKMIADEILKIIPNANIKYVKKDEDPRDYRVSFDKIAKKLDFRITKTVPDGLHEIYDIIRSGIVSDPDNVLYRNS